MTAEDLIRWRRVLGLKRTQAARMLGVSERTMTYYEKGRDGQPVDIPLSIAYACTAIYHRCPEWGTSYTSQIGRDED